MKASSNNEPYSIGQKLEVTVEKIVPGGYGLAFAERLTVFVSLAAPGDRLLVELVHLKKRTAFAEIVEILQPSAARITPPCPYFGTCGGCDFQQLNYKAQLEAKVSIVEDSLRRIGKIEYEGEIGIIGSPAEFSYRSRAQWHLDTQNKRLGYFGRHSHNVIDVDVCPILTPEMQTALESARAGIQWEKFWDPIADIEAAANDNGEISLFSPSSGESAKEISFVANGETYLFSAESFFQGNQLLIPKLLELSIGGVSGAAALDLYCGVGLFAIPLARKFRNVIGVEDNPQAVDFAEKNADLAGLRNLEFYSTSVDRFISRKDLGPIDLIVFDPPRSGADIKTVRRIAEIRPGLISYVSCDPSILARDLRILLDSGYEIRSITAVDLFPQNHHIETVVRLSLPKA